MFQLFLKKKKRNVPPFICNLTPSFHTSKLSFFIHLSNLVEEILVILLHFCICFNFTYEFKDLTPEEK